MGDRSARRGLSCPGCRSPLKEVYAEANYGRVLLLDQCVRCGGVWFDRFELYFAKAESLKSLARVDQGSLLSENPHQQGSWECPVCVVGLIPFNDPGLPPDTTIKRCPGCSGLWLNRGELARFGGRKTKTRGPADGVVPLETLKGLQKELDTARLLRGKENAPTLDEETVDTKEVVKDMGFLVLQALLRLLFKF